VAAGVTPLTAAEVATVLDVLGDADGSPPALFFVGAIVALPKVLVEVEVVPALLEELGGEGPRGGRGDEPTDENQTSDAPEHASEIVIAEHDDVKDTRNSFASGHGVVGMVAAGVSPP